MDAKAEFYRLMETSTLRHSSKAQKDCFIREFKKRHEEDYAIEKVIVLFSDLPPDQMTEKLLDVDDKLHSSIAAVGRICWRSGEKFN